MLLSKPGLSIRRLMSQRRRKDGLDCDGASLDFDDAPSLMVPSKDKGKPWISARTSSKKTIPKPIIVVQQTNSVLRISRPLPPLPDTPRSAASSLCSCEHHEVAAQYPGSRTQGLCLVLSKNDDDRPRSSLSASTRATDQQFSPLPSTTYQQRKEDMNPVTRLPTPRKTPSPRLDRSVNTTPKSAAALSPGLAENVRLLIRETDEAFNAVGSALAEAKAASRTLTDSPVSPTFTRPRKAPPPRPSPSPTGRPLASQLRSSPPRRSSVVSTVQSPIRTSIKSPLRSSPLPIRTSIKSPIKSPLKSSSLPRKSPVAKAQRKPSVKSKRRESQPRKGPKVQKSRGGVRWTLSENVSELFGLFSHVEADELLTPGQIQELRLKRLSQLQPKKSSETLNTDGSSDTPIEPFHMQDLPTRIGAAGVKLTVPSPIEEVPTPRGFDFGLDVKREDFSLPKKDKTAATAQQQQQQQQQPPKSAPADVMTFKDLSFPSPPMKSPLRSAGLSKPTTTGGPLPTIPEITVTAAPIPDDDSEYIYLPANPLSSAASPAFRHGPIRFARADLRPEPALFAADDTLDWTAFQMAILGGAGDFFSGSVDFSSSSSRTAAAIDEDEIDALIDFVSALGLESGGLRTSRGDGGSDGNEDSDDNQHHRHSKRHSAAAVSSTCGSPPATMLTSASASPASLSDECAAPIPVGPEHPNGFWNEGEGLDTSRFLSCKEAGLRRWTVEGRPKPYKGDRASFESVPQSPVFDMVVSRGTDGEEYVVPMGYNLGHDLGDFLRWESEDAYAGGYMS